MLIEKSLIYQVPAHLVDHSSVMFYIEITRIFTRYFLAYQNQPLVFILPWTESRLIRNPLEQASYLAQTLAPRHCQLYRRFVCNLSTSWLWFVCIVLKTCRKNHQLHLILKTVTKLMVQTHLVIFTRHSSRIA